eukprot:6358283-Amphidinium_carterae.1
MYYVVFYVVSLWLTPTTAGMAPNQANSRIVIVLAHFCIQVCLDVVRTTRPEPVTQGMDSNK